MKKKSLVSTITSFCIFFFSLAATANDFEITSFSRNGEISWDDTNTNGIYRVEWAARGEPMKFQLRGKVR